MVSERYDISRAISNAAYKAYENRVLSEIRERELPHHIAIIMDGNRRFASELSMRPLSGHLKGKNKLEEVLEWCIEIGIRMLTVYAFSTENFRRSKDEVNSLMAIFADSFKKAGDDERVHKHKIRIRAIGQRDMLPSHVRDAIAYAEERTKTYSDYHLNIAIAYGGREEILRAIKSIASDVLSGKVKVEDINEKLFANYLYTADLPDPDLVLRTSGEERISNFLLWQLAYSELYFADVYWPGFRKIDFLRAIRSYQLRQRRFGT